MKLLPPNVTIPNVIITVGVIAAFGHVISFVAQPLGPKPETKRER